MNVEEIFDKDYESILKAKKASNTTDSETIAKLVMPRSKLTNDKDIFHRYIRTFLNNKIFMASFIGRKYTNFSTSHEPEILNKDTKDVILKYLKDEGYKVVLQERSWPNSEHLRATILVSWKQNELKT